MSETKHTPGEMAVCNKLLRNLYAGDTLVAEVLDTAEGLEGSDAEADANARRLAAAWNATAGIPTAALEAGVVAELRAALNAYVVAQSRMLSQWSEVDSPARSELWRDLHACEDAALAALAAAKPLSE